jgi:hypothetical protein
VTDPAVLVCPSCEHVERLDPSAGPTDTRGTETTGAPGAADDGDGATCPACGSRRASRAGEPALPDPDSETSVKRDADDVADG